MMYVLYGADEKKVREKVSVLISHLRAKKPDAEYLRITEDEYTLPSVLEYSIRQGLFEKKSIILLDRIVQNKEAGKEIAEHFKEFVESENVFIFLEGTLDTKTVERIKKQGGKMQEFQNGAVLPHTAAPFNIFSIADAFGRRDKKQAWVLYREAITRGIAAEEIHAVLMWQVKSMLLAAEARTAEHAGPSPFVYKKSKIYAQKYGEKALGAISRELLIGYHDVRRGLRDIEIVLELQMLNL